MARYRYLAVDLVTRVVRDELPLLSCNFGWVANRAAPFSATINRMHPKATEANIDAGRTLIVVERDGQLLGDGIAWDPSADSGAAGVIAIEGASLASYFAHRRIREDRTYTAVDQAEIIADLFGWAQGIGSTAHGNTVGTPLGNIQLDTTVTANGVVRDRTYPGDERKPILEAVEQLSDVINGPDWRMYPDWDDTVDPPRIIHRLEVQAVAGTVIADPFAYGVNAAGYSFRRSGSLMATHVDAIGEGEGPDMLVGTATDPTAFPAYPQYDRTLSHKDVRQQATLDGHAQADLLLRRRPPKIVTMRMRRNAIPRLSSYRVGDVARVQIDDGWAQMDEFRRIIGVAVDVVDREGNEIVSVTFDVPDTAA